MSWDLRALAEKYVALTGEVEAVRRSMLACLTNGAGEHPARPTQPARQASGGSQPSRKAAIAAEAERTILELLRATPGIKTGQIAVQMQARSTTTIERLRRLKDRGAVQGGGNEGGVVPA